MKIGFSFGRCISDINTGKIALEDVLVIIARTRIESREHIQGVVDYYANSSYIGGSYETALEIAYKLWDTGRIHQPRLFNHQPTQIGHSINDAWMDLVPTNISDDENVAAAWRNYQIMLRMSADEKPTIPSHLKGY